MSIPRSPLTELLFALETVLEDDVLDAIKVQASPDDFDQYACLTGLEFLAVPEPGGQTLDDYARVMKEIRRRFPMRFAVLNFRAVLSAYTAIMERGKTDALSPNLLALMVPALKQAERAVSQ